ncbi:MAG: hypothetical protein IJX60_04295 [Paludibacteraceae bacterium]|nr:hypothetical protein [Paludibacteraceae bacterium]
MKELYFAIISLCERLKAKMKGGLLINLSINDSALSVYSFALSVDFSGATYLTLAISQIAQLIS